MADWFDGNGNGSTVDPGEMLAGDVHDAINALITAGALVSIGLTSDGGAMGVTVTQDGRWRREYFRSYEEVLAWMAEAVPAVQAGSTRSAPSAAPRPRSRRSRTS